MTLAELKNNLIHGIKNTNDLDTLELLHIILENKNSEIPILSEVQLKRLEESEKQIQRGEFYTEEEASRLTEKWFEGK